MASSIIQLQVLSGCDHNGGFYGVSKKAMADRIEKSSDRHKLLQGCENSLLAGNKTINDYCNKACNLIRVPAVKNNNFPDA